MARRGQPLGGPSWLSLYPRKRAVETVDANEAILRQNYLEAYLNVRGVERRQRTRHILGVM